MILDLELNDDIYDNPVERGITVKELIRWVVGDYMQFSRPRVIGPVPTPNPAEQTNTRVMKLSELLMKSMINQGAIKCSNCTQGLTLEDLNKGECSKCGADI